MPTTNDTVAVFYRSGGLITSEAALPTRRDDVRDDRRPDYARNVVEHANAAVVRRLFEAFERKDAVALRGFFAEDAVWLVGGASAVAGTYRGRRAIIRFLGSLPRLTDGTYSSRLIDVLASDDRAAVLYRATGRREERELDIDQLLLFKLRNGVVTDVVALPSDQSAFDAFWGSMP